MTVSVDDREAIAEVPASPDDRSPAVAPRSSMSRVKRLVWGGCVTGLVLLIAAPLSIAAGPDRGERVVVAAEWAALGRDLPEVGHGTILRVAYYMLLFLAAIGIAAGCWYALAVDSPPDRPDERSDRSGPA